MAFFLVAAGTIALPALGHESHAPHASKRELSTESHPWGREGDPAKATRVIRVDMSDAMRFTPGTIRVKQGDTVRFEIANKGAILHEMVIGTDKALAEHAEMMKKHPGMEHDEPYMAHVAPGKTGSIAWTFDRPGDYMYGCLVPGHWEAGMKGRITVEPRTERKSK